MNTYIKLAIKLGAVNAKMINCDSIITDDWVRLKCQYGCRRYKTNLCCPPYTPVSETTRKIIDSYNKIILIHCKKDNDPKQISLKLERELFLKGYHKSFGLGAGPCVLCENCNLLKCQFPENARPAMEACGIDVFSTARANGFPIEVLKNKSCKQNYYGLVLVE